MSGGRGGAARPPSSAGEKITDDGAAPGERFRGPPTLVRRLGFTNVDWAPASVYCGISYDPRHTLGRESKESRRFGESQVLAAEEDTVSVYRVTELIGTSSQSWADAAATAVNTARKTLRDLRVAEVVEQDLQVAEDGEITFRTRLRLSFKYEDEE